LVLQQDELPTLARERNQPMQAKDHKATLRQFEPAIEQLQKALELDPSFSAARQLLALSYAFIGKYQEALPRRMHPLCLRELTFVWIYMQER
jgi:tetratricopeptide (TPR) repeat protein